MSNEKQEPKQESKQITVSVETMRAVVNRGARRYIKPWEVAKEMGSDAGLQEAYEKRIQEITDAVMNNICDELL